MRIVSVTLNNFGIYKGHNTIPFMSDTEKKLTLIIGRNGAGKTTLLNGIKTALYGSMFFKSKSLSNNYQKFIMELMNKEALKQDLSTYGLEISFVSNILGFDGAHTIKREWLKNGDQIKENISVFRDQTLLDDHSSSDFLNALYQTYPVELFDLYLFDGERVDELSVLNHNVVETLETAFNINLYKSLRSDIETYAVKKVKTREITFLEYTKEKLAIELEQVDQQLVTLSQENKDLNDRILVVEQNISVLSNQGIKPVDHMDHVEIKAAQKKIDHLNKTYREKVVDYLPYSILHDEMRTLLRTLERENESRRFEEIISSLDDTLITNIKNDNDKLTLENIKLVTDAIKMQMSHKIEVHKIHQIDQEQFSLLKKQIRSLRTFNHKNLMSQKNTLNTMREAFSSLKGEVLKQQSEEYQVSLLKLLDLQSELTLYKSQLESNQVKQVELEERRNEITVERSKTDVEIWKLLKASNVDEIIVKLGRVLEQYVHAIKTKKLKSIQDDSLAMFNGIIRKQNFIKDILFENDKITFLDYNDNYLSHQHLSAGERQIFTLSLLMSVIKMSERRTPLVFDTLLGRLDQEHKSKLLLDLIKEAPDQIILLATDSEIDETMYESLKPYINQKINIDLSKPENQIQ